MKKLLSLFCICLVLFTLSACSTSEQPTNENTSIPDVSGSAEHHVLVAYFSATGNTKSVAGTIANCTNATLYEITPETPYSDEDLDYNNDNSRTSIEMNDPNARPAISGSVINMENYDTIFLGYPIWWGEAPRIINTFLEAYNFSGKTIIPFCTSGGSSINSSAAELESLTEGATWLDGQRFNRTSTREEMTEWINALNLGLQTA